MLESWEGMMEYETGMEAECMEGYCRDYTYCAMHEFCGGAY